MGVFNEVWEQFLYSDIRTDDMKKQFAYRFDWSSIYLGRSKMGRLSHAERLSSVLLLPAQTNPQREQGPH
jgi:hypothetical protein